MNKEFEKKYKQKLLDTFKVLISLFKEHNLNYCLSGGSAIGAVRHHGIIPWDDDIDICMLREDYNKFLSLPKEQLPNGYEIVSVYDKESFTSYAKFINTNTTFWEIENLPIISGIFIDITPIDYFDKSKSDFVKEWKKMKSLIRLRFLAKSKFNFKYVSKKYYTKDTKMFLTNLLSLFVPNFIGEIARRKIIKLDKQYGQVSQADLMVCFYGAYGKKEVYESNWFLDTIDMQFEDILVKLPIGFDNYLRGLFGDYMILPPKEKRICEHRHYYVNLSERISIEEVRKRVKKGIVQEL